MKTGTRQSLASRLSLWIVSLGIVIFITVIATNYLMSRALLDDYVEKLASAATSSTVKKIESVFDRAETNANSLASVIAIAGTKEDEIHKAITALLPINARTFGMSVALEPHILIEDLGDFAPYYFKKGDELIYENLATDDYDYKNQSWYSEPKKINAPIWSDPYFDEGGGNVQMITYSKPIRLPGTREFAGIATADIKLTWLDRIADEIKVGKSGYGYIISRNDIVIAHPDRSLNMKNLADVVSDNIKPGDWQKYLDSKSSSASVSLKVPCPYQHGNCRIAIESLANTGWKVIVVSPEQDYVSDINILTRNISYIAVTGIVVLLLVIMTVTRRLTSPLANLALATKDIGAGNLDTEIPEAVRQDEIGALTDDFSSMRSALKTYIKEVQTATAKQQKLESEIQIAKDIQMSMIPGYGNAFINNDVFQLYALLRPARTVGGDLYYFQQSDQILHFILGDVSDKGVPAALFMAKTVTLYTRALRDKLSPGQTFSMMNDILAENNDACMFVTALCGTIDLKTGSVVMSNAGHMDPVIKDSKSTREHAIKGATALGLMDAVEYPDIEFKLDHHTSMIMYTDGISEAHDIDSNQYSDEKLIELITNIDTSNSEEIGNKIIDSVDKFADKAEQFDDITILIIRYQ
jgi:sigma-B regulation protein RsbU (phosphoserine phosphatase)